jgi:hypothetical protein
MGCSSSCAGPEPTEGAGGFHLWPRDCYAGDALAACGPRPLWGSWSTTPHTDISDGVPCRTNMLLPVRRYGSESYAIGIGCRRVPYASGMADSGGVRRWPSIGPSAHHHTDGFEKFLCATAKNSAESPLAGCRPEFFAVCCVGVTKFANDD